MRRVFARAMIERIRSDNVLYLLTVFGVALGVASVLSIRVLSTGATGAFAGTVEALGSDVALSVVGSAPTLPDSLYATAYQTPGVALARPIYEVSVTPTDHPGRYLDVFGVDLLRAPAVPMGDDAPSFDPLAAIHQPGWAAVTPQAADAFGWQVGDSVQVASGARYATLVIGATVDFSRVSALAAPNLVLMDIANVQALLGSPGRLTRIDLTLAADADPEAVTDALRSRLPSTMRVTTPGSRVEEANNLLSAFRLNLFALSLVSVVVGGYLVYGAVSAALVRRRREVGVLRSVGATRAQVMGLILAEVTALAALGSMLGIPLGYLAAAQNVDKVSSTVTNLYMLREIRSLSIGADVIALGLFVGIGAAWLAVAAPAWELSRRPIRYLLSAASPRARLTAWAPWLAGVSGVLALASLGLALRVGHTWKPAGFILAVATLGCITLVTPAVLLGLSRLVPRRGFDLGFSIGNLASRLGAATTAVGALAASVSMVVGVTVMVTSFRSSLVGWIDRTIQADIYVTTSTWTRSPADSALDSDLVDRLASWPGVVDMDRLRQITLRTDEGPLRISGVDFARATDRNGSRDRRLELVSGTMDGLGERMRAGGAVISEPLSIKRGLAVGDTLWAEGAAATVGYPIEGVYTDYSSEWGSALVHLPSFARAFGPGDPQSVALTLSDPATAESTVDEMRAGFSDRPLDIRSNRRLRDESLRLFDQTFAITDGLKLMAAMVAISGIMLTLLVWTRERSRELALYRALGASPGQLFRLFVGEGFAMGLVGVVLGGIGGAVLARILVDVINRAYFGWSIQVAWPWTELAMQGAGVLVAALAASVYPAIVARSVTASALTEERG